VEEEEKPKTIVIDGRRLVMLGGDDADSASSE
jgi:hypothetical protein